jgi:MATE family multidrug resistance protein
MLMNALKQNLKISLPILLTRMLGIASNLIAMILIARLGTAALSASALIMGIFSVCVLLVMAFSFSVCALVATACGEQKNEEVGKIIISSLLLNSLLAIPFMLVFYTIKTLLIWLHQPLPVAVLTGEYFHGLLFGYLPMLWASILEQFYIGIGKPRYIVYLSIMGLVIMPLFSSILIFGQWGISPLGMRGAGYAVTASSFFSLAFLIGLILFKKWHLKYHLFNIKTKFDFILLKKLYQLGWPTALQFGGEFLAYALMTLMMGWVSVMALAAQQIILQFTSVVVMIPTSISQATAVLVGQANGQSDNQAIKYHVNASLITVTVLMLVVALVYTCVPTLLIHIYLDVNNPANASLLSLTKVILLITAFSQCFDGIRNVLAGAYRGIQETKIPMRISIFVLWLISVPLGYIFGFILRGGAVGIRWGFTLGIILATCLLLLSWYKAKRSIVIRKQSLVPEDPAD